MMARAGKSGDEKRDWPSVRIAVVYGPEQFMQAEYVRQAREALEKAHGTDGVSVFQFDGESASIADVLDECRSFDLMQRHKLVVVDSADRLLAASEEDEAPAPKGRGKKKGPAPATSREIMQRYAESPSDGATLILGVGKWNKGKLDALIEEVGFIEKCEGVSAERAASWAVKRASKRHGATLPADVAAALVERVGTDLGRIDGEIGKLACAAAPGAPIEMEDLRALVGRGGEQDFWQVQGPIASGDAEAALGAVVDAITLWREQPTGVCWAEIDLVRKAHAVARLVEDGQNAYSAAGRLRIWSNKDEVIGLAGRASSRRWAALLGEGIRMDVRAKTGFSDAARTAEMLAVRISGVGR